MDKKVEINKEERPLMVTIRCITYNHELYIRQCLEGFIMQKTNFRFEAIVHDDASTDETANIIREYAEKYPDIIKPIFETENQYSKLDGSIQRIMSEHIHGKYVAMCEGDDYWIDPLKLQKQVDFLEAHENYGLVHTFAKMWIQKENWISKNLIGEYFNDIDDLIISNRIITATTCIRTSLYKSYDIINPSWKMGDYPLWLYIVGKSKVHFINECTTVYRVLENSASHSIDCRRMIDFYLSANSISKYFAEYYKKSYLYRSVDKMSAYGIVSLRAKHPNCCTLKDIIRYFGVRSLSLKLLILYLLTSFIYGRLLLVKIWKNG